MLFKTEQLALYFGNSTDGVHASDEQRNIWSQQTHILELPAFSSLQCSLGIKHLVFDHQVHGCSGRIVTTDSVHNLRSWTHDGDFLMTQDPAIGIGVLTADCLPIVVHDAAHGAIAVIHAGWRGSVQRIAIKALEAMHNAFNTQAQEVTIFFGPCIGSCCYSVGTEVINALGNKATHVLETRNKNIYFNLRAYNELLLNEYGVPTNAFNSTYTTCTHCKDTYCSYRRNATQYRQLTVACLTNQIHKNNLISFR